ncbi:HD domain-containing protein [Enterococcus rivorum]|uniref:Metal-dependent phosphohydrolase n=1 Tax=Enterococcus rivorum TaxID=762845 RepID=A0A1E5KW31_9ENTE|nr:HD domain-containing protein [Enterococcus rivorum]MBP2100134.1 uncharacterized protein [Enterococcus rivorum]OEH82076.1 metal-dependent phosphohydrolase [Enterococcus rivorum]
MEEKLEKIKVYTRKVLANDKTGHGLDHIERVVRMAEKIAESENCNQFIVIAAAYLHDTVDDKVVKDETEAFKQLVDFLEEIKLEPVEIEHIIHIIKNMSFSKSLSGTQEELSLEGKIVQDADRLDSMGAIGIARTLYYGGAKGRKLYDPKIAPRKLTSKEEYRTGDETTINHFYEKILTLNNLLNTDYAKRIGKKRQQFLENYLTEFLEEMDAK